MPLSAGRRNQRHPPRVNSWRRLVRTGAEPQGVAHPGLLLLAAFLAVGHSALGVSAFTDGRALQGVVGLGIAACFAGWAVATLRRRRCNERG